MCNHHQHRQSATSPHPVPPPHASTHPPTQVCEGESLSAVADDLVSNVASLWDRWTDGAGWRLTWLPMVYILAGLAVGRLPGGLDALFGQAQRHADRVEQAAFHAGARHTPSIRKSTMMGRAATGADIARLPASGS